MKFFLNKLLSVPKKIYRISKVKSFVYTVTDLFGLVDNETIRIDGGLGSQIIGYMQFLSAKKKNPNIRCDVSFFENTDDHPMFLSDVTFREWQLKYYNISLDELLISSPNYSIGRLRPNTKSQGIQLAMFFNNGLKDFNWQEVFKIRESTLTSLKEFDVDSESIYTAVHIRRGDFLKFSSLVISDGQFLEFLSNVRYLLTKRVLIISDDVFADSFKTDLENILSNCELTYVSGGNELSVHALMRNSQILITSNSMFSLSAAILQRPGGVAMLPNHFFGDDFKFHNDAVGSLSNWMILSERPEVKL